MAWFAIHVLFVVVSDLTPVTDAGSCSTPMEGTSCPTTNGSTGTPADTTSSPATATGSTSTPATGTPTCSQSMNTVGVSTVVCSVLMATVAIAGEHFCYTTMLWHCFHYSLWQASLDDFIGELLHAWL